MIADYGIVILFFLVSAVFALGFTLIVEYRLLSMQVNVNDILYIVCADKAKPVKVSSIKITELITVYETVDIDGKKHIFMQSQIGKECFRSEYEALKHIKENKNERTEL